MMSGASLPVLYSFRRCPYAIRARLALRYSGIKVALREVDLGDKPPEMLAASPKGSVPVLVLEKGSEQPEVIDESLDVMLWALAQNDPDGWLDIDIHAARQLVDANDDQFKPWLDRYKYPEHFEKLEPGEARGHCETFLQQLEHRLHADNYLCGDTVSIVDMAMYSFVRQFAFVDTGWFAASSLVGVNRWLNDFLEGALFTAVMEKYPKWQAGDIEPVV
jgi:glutathione S-transferase